MGDKTTMEDDIALVPCW